MGNLSSLAFMLAGSDSEGDVQLDRPGGHVARVDEDDDDLAVGVVIGAAFGKIVTSLVNDLLMPPIGVATGTAEKWWSVAVTAETFFLEDHPLQDLLFPMMRSRGIHILDNFPCFMTTAHSEEDIQAGAAEIEDIVEATEEVTPSRR